MDHSTYMPTNQYRQPQPNSDAAYADWIAERVKLLYDRFKARTDEWNDGKEAFRTIVLNLARYPKAVVEYVTDEITGLHTRQIWSPSIAELVSACEAEKSYLDKVAHYSALPVAQRLPQPKRTEAESYTVMVEKHGRPFGPFEAGRILPYGV